MNEFAEKVINEVYYQLERYDSTLISEMLKLAVSKYSYKFKPSHFDESEERFESSIGTFVKARIYSVFGKFLENNQHYKIDFIVDKKQITYRYNVISKTFPPLEEMREYFKILLADDKNFISSISDDPYNKKISVELTLGSPFGEKAECLRDRNIEIHILGLFRG